MKEGGDGGSDRPLPRVVTELRSKCDRQTDQRREKHESLIGAVEAEDRVEEDSDR